MNTEVSSLIAPLDQALLNNHRLDTELFEELEQAQHELGILAGDRPFSPFLRPQFLSRSQYDRIAHAAQVLAVAFDRMTLVALANDDILAELALTETEERYARMDPGYPEVCNSSRLDSFFTSDGFAFLEYNGETPAGITDQIQIEKVLAQIPETRRFLDEHRHWMPRPHVHLLKALVSAYRDFGGKREMPSIAIVDWTGVSTFTEFEVLQEYFESCGHRSIIADPGELDYDGTTLRAGDLEIDIFYKRVVIHELLEGTSEDHPIRRAYRDGNIMMANSFRTKIPHKKASFAVLRNERFASLFTDAEHEIIRKHIPWTARVRERRISFHQSEFDLLELIRERRDRFLLKPNDDYGGSGIVIGWESTESEWDDAIEYALAHPFVVQERVDVEKVRFPEYRDGEARMEELLIDFDPFMFRGKVEGGLVRLSPQSLVNVAAGGGEAALAVLEGY